MAAGTTEWSLPHKEGISFFYHLIQGCINNQLCPSCEYTNDDEHDENINVDEKAMQIPRIRQFIGEKCGIPGDTNQKAWKEMEFLLVKWLYLLVCMLTSQPQYEQHQEWNLSCVMHDSHPLSQSWIYLLPCNSTKHKKRSELLLTILNLLAAMQFYRTQKKMCFTTTADSIPETVHLLQLMCVNCTLVWTVCFLQNSKAIERLVSHAVFADWLERWQIRKCFQALCMTAPRNRSWHLLTTYTCSPWSP